VGGGPGSVDVGLLKMLVLHAKLKLTSSIINGIKRRLMCIGIPGCGEVFGGMRVFEVTVLKSLIG